MKRNWIVLLSSAIVLSGASQTVAPVATPLGAYAQSLQAPARVAADPAGNVYVTDPPAGRVVLFDAFGRQAACQTGFAGPLGIAVDARGVIYLAEEKTGSVSVFDARWNLLYQLGAGGGEFQLPNHLAVLSSPSNSTIYVADSKANAIKVYAGPALITQFGSAGTGAGQFDFPAGLCLSPSGELFVVDQNNDRVQVFDLAGRFLRAFALGTGNPSGR
ncbi:MAG: NHL repeat-containing protein, partial [Verrucomicrobia bacterium]|nr:NHL repeat-containing protein [Verrucomicrobiota bacterium]